MSNIFGDEVDLSKIIIKNIDVKDIRFPTSLEAHGSDAMHTDPDYSCAYVIIECSNTTHQGYGLTFTIGKGTEIVCQACNSLKDLVVERDLLSIFNNFRRFHRSLTCHSQLRWLGPEKGVIHLATAAIVNAIWDLFAKISGLPLWKFLCSLTPEELVSMSDFTCLSDAITEAEALDILRSAEAGKSLRESEMMSTGYPVYITSAGWLGYSEDEIRRRVQSSLNDGFTRFKIKVGENLANDLSRCNFVRELIGWENTLMVDANQRWEGINIHCN
jgi:L-fuconate dehydratase